VSCSKATLRSFEIRESLSKTPAGVSFDAARDGEGVCVIAVAAASAGAAARQQTSPPKHLPQCVPPRWISCGSRVSQKSTCESPPARLETPASGRNRAWRPLSPPLVFFACKAYSLASRASLTMPGSRPPSPEGQPGVAPQGSADTSGLEASGGATSLKRTLDTEQHTDPPVKRPHVDTLGDAPERALKVPEPLATTAQAHACQSP
jgi:hypothetical protein